MMDEGYFPARTRDQKRFSIGTETANEMEFGVLQKFRVNTGANQLNWDTGDGFP